MKILTEAKVLVEVYDRLVYMNEFHVDDCTNGPLGAIHSKRATWCSGCKDVKMSQRV